jgi:hypothetical protein
MMGAAAASLADVAILTSDNPRSEDPLAILAAMLNGVLSVPQEDRARVIIEPDRAAAIAQAVSLAAAGDVIVVAGKGHETGQYVAGAVLPFDDRQVTAAALAQRAHGQPGQGERAEDQRDQDQRAEDQLGLPQLGDGEGEGPLASALQTSAVNR